jgi:hypothetical protein
VTKNEAKNYGCYNRPDYRKMLPVQDGWWLDGQTRVAKMVATPFRMTPECQYTHTALGRKDHKCVGCKRRA